MVKLYRLQQQQGGEGDGSGLSGLQLPEGLGDLGEGLEELGDEQVCVRLCASLADALCRSPVLFCVALHGLRCACSRRVLSACNAPIQRCVCARAQQPTASSSAHCACWQITFQLLHIQCHCLSHTQIDDLLAWSSNLDYSAYVDDWMSLACTLGTEAYGIPTQEGSLLASLPPPSQVGVSGLRNKARPD